MESERCLIAWNPVKKKSSPDKLEQVWRVGTEIESQVLERTDSEWHTLRWRILHMASGLVSVLCWQEKNAALDWLSIGQRPTEKPEFSFQRSHHQFDLQRPRPQNIVSDRRPVPPSFNQI